MSRDFSSSTVTDTEFDLVDELRAAAADIEKDLKPSVGERTLERLAYLKFLINELDDSLSGEFKTLRQKRFITKKSG